jgi:glycosyltransferase involved in cell wall biosynthesis
VVPRARAGTRLTLRVAYVYANPRDELAAAVARGEAPDTGLLGQNHLAEHGIEAWIHRPRLRRRHRAAGPLHRVTWLAREAALPWELGHADAVCTPLGTLFPLASRLRRRPYPVVFNISFCTALSRSTGLKRRTLAASLRSAPAIVCFADAQRRRLLEQIDGAPERVHVALLGVDDAFYAPARADGGYVLAVGRDLGRDYGTFADAMRRLGRPAVLVASARNLAGVVLPGNVSIRLDVSALELRQLYAEASCVVVPTRREEFRHGADCSGQTVLLDAMAMGRPVVVTERSTLAEYVDEGRTALTVPPGDAEALAGAVERTLDDDVLRAQLGTAGRRRVEERHTTRRFAARLAEILEGLPSAA